MEYLRYNAEWISAVTMALFSIVTFIYIRKQTITSEKQKDIELFKLRLEHKNAFTFAYNEICKYIGFDNGRCIKTSDCTKTMITFKEMENILDAKHIETSFLFNKDKNILKDENTFIQAVKKMYPTECAIYRPNEKVFFDFENSYKNIESIYAQYI